MQNVYHLVIKFQVFQFKNEFVKERESSYIFLNLGKKKGNNYFN